MQFFPVSACRLIENKYDVVRFLLNGAQLLPILFLLQMTFLTSTLKSNAYYYGLCI